jgi:hypothetical protein
MTVTTYQRDSDRFNLEAAVVLEDFRTGFCYDGILYNYSSDGVYFECGYAPRPGRRIYMNVAGLPDIFALQVYIVEIKWRRPLPESASFHPYGVGAKYC